MKATNAVVISRTSQIATLLIEGRNRENIVQYGGQIIEYDSMKYSIISSINDYDKECSTKIKLQYDTIIYNTRWRTNIM